MVAELARRRSDAAGRLRDSGGMSAREANKATKTADGLAKLPKTREALQAGEISPGQAEQLASRMNKPELANKVRDNEEALLERARNEDTDEFARTMRTDDIEGSPDGGTLHAQRQRRSRMAHMWIDPDTGMHHLFAKFDPATGARISTSVQAMVDKIWRAENLSGGVRNKRQVDQRRADALEALICRNTTTTTTTNTNTNTTTGPAGVPRQPNVRVPERPPTTRPAARPATRPPGNRASTSPPTTSTGGPTAAAPTSTTSASRVPNIMAWSTNTTSPSPRPRTA